MNTMKTLGLLVAGMALALACMVVLALTGEVER